MVVSVCPFYYEVYYVERLPRFSWLLILLLPLSPLSKKREVGRQPVIRPLLLGNLVTFSEVELA